VKHVIENTNNEQLQSSKIWREVMNMQEIIARSQKIRIGRKIGGVISCLSTTTAGREYGEDRSHNVEKKRLRREFHTAAARAWADGSLHGVS
jgi:hypothetical protein